MSQAPFFFVNKPSSKKIEAAKILPFRTPPAKIGMKESQMSVAGRKWHKFIKNFYVIKLIHYNFLLQHIIILRAGLWQNKWGFRNIIGPKDVMTLLWTLINYKNGVFFLDSQWLWKTQIDLLINQNPNINRTNLL